MCLSQLGTEEELLQLSRQTIEILCVSQFSIGEATESEKNAKNTAYLKQVQKKNKKLGLSQLGTEE